MSESTQHTLYRAPLTENHLLVPRLRSYLNGVEVTKRPFELRIVRYDADEIYLFECDEQGVEFTDTLDENLAEAMRMAEYYWGVSKETWGEVLK